MSGEVKQELRLQTKASSAAPEVFGFCEFKYRSAWFSAVIMQKVEQSTLDDYLMNERSERELNDILDQIAEIFDSMASDDVRMTHGDLALFNIGYNIDGSRASGVRLVLLDFDRSSDSVFMPEYDYVRIVMELSKSTRSWRESKSCPRTSRDGNSGDGGKCAVPMHPSNEKFLLAAFRSCEFKCSLLGKSASRRLPLRILRNVKDTERKWAVMEADYCKRAGVLCVDWG